MALALVVVPTLPTAGTKKLLPKAIQISAASSHKEGASRFWSTFYNIFG